MRLYRAVSYAELQDIQTAGLLRPGPPAFQGKLLAESLEDAAEWGRRLYADGQFHLIEVEAPDAVVQTPEFGPDRPRKVCGHRRSSQYGLHRGTPHPVRHSMTAITPVPVTVRWYSPSEGGRIQPPAGPQYATTGRFSDQPLEAMFSVVLMIPNSGAAGTSQTVGELRPLIPQNVPDFADRLARGDRFVLHEGPKADAECTVLTPGD
jgi:hypothetical protein